VLLRSAFNVRLACETSVFQAAAAARIAAKRSKNILCIQDAARSGDVALVQDYLTVDAGLVNNRDARYKCHLTLFVFLKIKSESLLFQPRHPPTLLRLH
jgi:hypothetical protein